MTRIGRVSAMMAVLLAILLGFGCGGMGQFGPVSGQHHHCPDAPDQHSAILAHAPCCGIALPGPTGYVLAAIDRTQTVDWFRPVQTLPSGQPVSPDPRPPKSIL